MQHLPIEELIAQLDTYTGFTHFELMEQAAARQEEITPHLLNLLEQMLADPHAWTDPAEHNINCYLLILLGHFAETAAHQKILSLCRLPGELTDQLFGDFIGHSLPGVLLRTSGGDLSGVRQLMLDPDANEFVRWNAGTALCLAVFDELLDHDETVIFFSQLLKERNAAEADSSFWTGVLDSLLLLHPAAAMEEIRRGFADELFEKQYTYLEDVEEIVAAGADSRGERLKRDYQRCIPENFRDYMSWWDEPARREQTSAFPHERETNHAANKKRAKSRSKNKQAKKSRRKNRKK